MGSASVRIVPYRSVPSQARPASVQRRIRWGRPESPDRPTKDSFLSAAPGTRWKSHPREATRCRPHQNLSARPGPTRRKSVQGRDTEDVFCRLHCLAFAQIKQEIVPVPREIDIPVYGVTHLNSPPVVWIMEVDSGDGCSVNLKSP